MRYCGRTRDRKRKFPSEAVAANAARLKELQNGSAGGVYLCPYCDGWHLTTQVDRPGTISVEWDAR